DSGEGGVTQHMVRLQPIGRMNAVLAVTRKPEMLHRIETWINRLDNTNNARSSIHVYNVKYGEARQIARALNDIFGGGSGSSGTLDSDTGQIAPGSGLSSSSSGSALSRLSAGQSGQMSAGSGNTRMASSSSTGGTGNDATQAGYGAA